MKLNRELYVYVEPLLLPRTEYNHLFRCINTSWGFFADHIAFGTATVCPVCCVPTDRKLFFPETVEIHYGDYGYARIYGWKDIETFKTV